tara:strand:- start:2454 stop:5027 length:2574 start_codon:yes stop_codon:yes gene_type:complete
MPASKNDIVINEIAMKREGDEEYTTMSLGDGNEAATLASFTISEGLFQIGLKGQIILNDPNPDSSDLGLSLASFAKAGSRIKFSFYTTDEFNTAHSINGLEFYVYNVAYVSDLGPGVIKNNATSQSMTYRLEFASYEGTSLDFQDFTFLESDFVGRIDEFIGRVTSQYLSPDNPDNTTQIPAEIVTTYNGMWLKNDQSCYPWGKETGAGSLMKVINSSVDFALPALGTEVDDDGTLINRGAPEDKNPTYTFYQSLPQGQWHFRPIGGAFGFGLNLSEGTEGNGFHTYYLSNDETVYKRANAFKLVTTNDILSLQNTGALGAHYTLIEPNWMGIYSGISADCDRKECYTTEDDEEVCETISMTNSEEEAFFEGVNTYYHDTMSIASHFSKKDIEYRYTDDFFIPVEDGDGDYVYEYVGPLFGGKAIGFSENPQFSKIDDVIYGYFDTRYLNKPFPTETDDYCSTREQKYMWQTMFDITDMPLYSDENVGTVGIYDIVNNIRKPCKGGRIAYGVLKDLKEQWNRYRYSICCDGTGRDEFTAMLVGFTGAGASSDRELIPFGLSGATIDNFYRYSFVEVEVWPKELVPKGVSANNFIEGASGELTYYEYLQSKDINPATGGPHQIHISGHGEATGITFSIGLSASTDDGQEYGVNQEQEFFVIPVEGGERAMFTAYNTNELVNSQAFTNAGINVDGYSYPDGFDLMPIGAMTGGVNEETTPLPTTYMGSIVKMESLIPDDLNTIKTESDNVGNSGGYTGPIGIAGSPCMSVIGLLNQIMGTKNLPSTFCGSTLDISYKDTGIDDDGNEIDDYVNIERDDSEIRPCVLDNASAQSNAVEGITAPSIVYLFSAENDHDGRCS